MACEALLIIKIMLGGLLGQDFKPFYYAGHSISAPSGHCVVPPLVDDTLKMMARLNDVDWRSQHDAASASSAAAHHLYPPARRQREHGHDAGEAASRTSSWRPNQLSTAIAADDAEPR